MGQAGSQVIDNLEKNSNCTSGRTSFYGKPDVLLPPSSLLSILYHVDRFDALNTTTLFVLLIHTTIQPLGGPVSSLPGRTHSTEEAIYEARQGWKWQYRSRRVLADSPDCQ